MAKPTRKKLRSLIDRAKHYAKHFHIMHAGVTIDGGLVTTLECVAYQKKQNKLLCHVDGQWKMTLTEQGTWQWTHGPVIVTYFYDIKLFQLPKK